MIGVLGKAGDTGHGGRRLVQSFFDQPIPSAVCLFVSIPAGTTQTCH